MANTARVLELKKSHVWLCTRTQITGNCSECPYTAGCMPKHAEDREETKQIKQWAGSKITTGRLQNSSYFGADSVGHRNIIYYTCRHRKGERETNLIDITSLFNNEWVCKKTAKKYKNLVNEVFKTIQKEATNE